MTTRLALGLALALGFACLVGCGGDRKPAPLSAEQEKQLEEQLNQAHQAEGAAAQTAPEGEEPSP